MLGYWYHGILDTWFWVSLILGYWYQGIIDACFWVSLILGYWYLGIIDTRAGYLRLRMQYVKITLWRLTHKTSQAPHFFSPGKLTCILHPLTSAHPLERAWRRNANVLKPQFHWLYSSGRSLLAPHEEASTPFWCLRRSLGDTRWFLPLPPWGDSPSLPGHPISFECICGYACNMWKLLLDDSPTKHLKRHIFFSPGKLTCILHPLTSAHPLERAWRRNANALKPQFHWLYSSGRSLLAPHEEASTPFWCLRRSLGDTRWVLPLPPWGDSPSLPGHPISFELVPSSACTTAQPAWWPHPHLSDLLWRHFPVSRPSRGSCPLCGCSSASTPPLSCRRQEPCSESGSHFPASPPPWPQTWSLRKVVVAPPPALTY